MPTHGFFYTDRSKEWKFWREHYKAKGVKSQKKLISLAHRKMLKLYGI